MKKKYVLDAGALSVYFAGNIKVKKYFDEIFNNTATGFVCEINLAEFYYKSIKFLGIEATEIRYLAIRKKLNVIAPDVKLTRDAAKLKARFERAISLADAYAIALTNHVKGELITTDSKIHKLQLIKTHLIKI
ncbi:MAG: PIN domain-containing protein [Candidatus Asgardarchaeia archaeon]